MVRQVIHILLVLSIIACPLRCQDGMCAAADACCGLDAGSPPCCTEQHAEHERGDEADHRSDQPAPEQSPAGICQCICGGALHEVDDSVVPPSSNLLDDVSDIESSLIQAACGSRSKMPVASANAPPGSHLFILNMSMLL